MSEAYWKRQRTDIHRWSALQQAIYPLFSGVHVASSTLNQNVLKTTTREKSL